MPEPLASLRIDPVLLGPMTEAEPRGAIVGPARQPGAQVNERLVDPLIPDLASREATGFAHSPCALPLLSHALRQSWERARGNRLSTAEYRSAGGLDGTVSQTAETLYTEQELEALGADPDQRAEDGVAAAAEVLDRFVAERLVTVEAQACRWAGGPSFRTPRSRRVDRWRTARRIAQHRGGELHNSWSSRC